eukprot:TRINITY_DN9707_c0_g2_i3.p1 TRINITY_DN9707_c0_g2~~TRINITY_DN9707_c0_g2_i3.p1  ORF type:complete len:318 (+),score=65.10 TRINITY_DN9707_c0_g2_i3:127-1080(+)
MANADVLAKEQIVLANERQWLIEEVLPESFATLGLLLKAAITRLDTSATRVSLKNSPDAVDSHRQRGSSVTDRRRIQSVSSRDTVPPASTSSPLASTDGMLRGNVRVAGCAIVAAEVEEQLSGKPKSRTHSAISTKIKAGQHLPVLALTRTLTALREALDQLEDHLHASNTKTPKQIMTGIKSVMQYVQLAKRCLTLRKPPKIEESFRSLSSFDPPLPADAHIDVFVEHARLVFRVVHFAAQDVATLTPAARERSAAMVDSTDLSGYIFTANRQSWEVTKHQEAVASVAAWSQTLHDIHDIQTMAQDLLANVAAIAE